MVEIGHQKSSGTWNKSATLDEGVQELLGIIQQQHWNVYEVYLIRRMFSYLDQATLDHEMEEARKLLSHYYNFLTAFDLEPYAKTCREEELCGCPNNHRHSLGPTQWKCVQMYNAVEKEFNEEEREQLFQRVLGLIKENSSANIELLHRCICELYYFDKGFASKVLALKSWGLPRQQ
jgi:hypothetical protein